jgi:hypothetical protein
MDHDALLAQLSATVAALDDPAALSLPAKDLAALVAGVDDALRSLASLHRLLSAELVVIADSWPIGLPDGRSVDRDPGKPGWNVPDAPRLLTHSRDQVVRRIALDRSTGEVDPVLRAVVGEALDAFVSAWSIQPKWTGLAALGLSLDEYRERRPAQPKVVVHEARL